MNISGEGVLHLQQTEGCSLKPYKDDYSGTSRVEYSIGYGHQIQPGEEYLMQGITKQKANELFLKDIVKYVKAVNDGLTVQVTQSVFDMLVSFCYNVGTGAFKKSRLLKAINEQKGNTYVAALWLKSFITPAVLIGRRAKEVAYAFKVGDTVKSNSGIIAIVALAALFFLLDD